jgi:hypothetical protein
LTRTTEQLSHFIPEILEKALIMGADTNPILRHQLDFTLHNLPSTAVRIDFPVASGAEILLLTSIPTVRLGASYSDTPVLISNIFLQPQRIQFDITSPPPVLPITLQIKCNQAFVFGWLQVPENIQTSIATVVEQIRIIGPSYWALPLGQGVRDREGRPVAATSAEKAIPARSAPAPVAKPVQPATAGSSITT